MNRKKVAAGILLLSLALIFDFSVPVRAYVPTAEEIFAPLVRHYGDLKTLEVNFSTILYDEDCSKDSITLPEKIYLKKKAGSFRAERFVKKGKEVLLQRFRKTSIASPVQGSSDARRIDTVLPLIMLATSVEVLINDLSRLGVETGITAFDRVDREVAFVIGRGRNGGPESRLWIEKERCLPLRFVGEMLIGGEKVILRAEYSNYIFVDKQFWFPKKIEVFKNDVLWARSTVQKILAGQDISDHIFAEDSSAVYQPVPDFLNLKE